ncbi:Uma2 family endonuclease [Candidatus Synechococcus calcipolaris G9]|uniref:Uma2 family endonuclease n=1 Tax=Candidatus Synechococcus calcipolaris G9 TaxID=1497997 RepID=A0ABT6F2J9_9SYNE|nr:Uma2 family endonuclease [Candidatus Synechococcus calcipolaris]MDG2992082.1 Uma2 family endonuclease [Candidatus Synechococcus calcipolaris G9]
MLAKLSKPLYTIEDYLALEAESEVMDGIRREYRNGEIICMTGGTPEHNKVVGSLYAVLWTSLRKKPYSVFITDQRLWVPELQVYTYPDVMVMADPVILQENRKDTVTNPLLIAEVLSDSTSAYDRGDKFAAYRTIPTFQEYLVIDQTRPYGEQFVKQADHQWLFSDHSGLDAKINLVSVGVEVALVDLYESVGEL